MAYRLTNPFAFEPGGSALARFHPLAKLGFLLAVTSAMMRARLEFALALFVLALILSIRIPRAGSGPLRAIALLVLFAALVRGILPGDGRLFDVGSLPYSALYAARLLGVYLYSRIFYTTTKVSEIGDWLTMVVRAARTSWQRLIALLCPRCALPRRVPHAASSTATPHAEPSILSDPGMLFSIVLLFLPRIFDAYSRIREAGEVRGISLSRRNARRSLAMLEHLILESMLIAFRTSLAMQVRAYSPERSLRLSPLRGLDWALIAVSAGLFALR